jgi:ATP-dependent RNA helicase DeaD
LIREFERVTGQKIEIAQVPTIADLRARRLELTRASFREALLGGDLDGFRVVVETLAEEFDPFDIAVAGVKLVHQSSGGDAEPSEEIPVVAPPSPERARARHDRERPKRGDKPPRQPSTAPRRPALGMVRLYIGAGRNAGVRPADLVGAIAGETGISGRSIGAINISERFSLVEVPSDAVADVIQALRSTRIKGKKVLVRPDRQEGR